MPSVRVVEESSASPEQVLEAARDFSPRRAELWRDVYTEHLTIHDRGETWADVTEGNPWLVWERRGYDWSQPGSRPVDWPRGYNGRPAVLPSLEALNGRNLSPATGGHCLALRSP